MNQSFENTTKTAPGTGRVAFIQACWHREIVNQCWLSFVGAIGNLNVSNDRIDFFEVPGLEITCFDLVKLWFTCNEVVVEACDH